MKSFVNQLGGDFRETRSRLSTSLSHNRLNNKLHILNMGERKWDCIVFLIDKYQSEEANNILL